MDVIVDDLVEHSNVHLSAFGERGIRAGRLFARLRVPTDRALALQVAASMEVEGWSFLARRRTLAGKRHV